VDVEEEVLTLALLHKGTYKNNKRVFNKFLHTMSPVLGYFLVYFRKKTIRVPNGWQLFCVSNKQFRVEWIKSWLLRHFKKKSPY
jgi:hypothetical protein